LVTQYASGGTTISRIWNARVMSLMDSPSLMAIRSLPAAKNRMR
jgi:hypothetical protein